MARTLQDRYAQALLIKGWTPVPTSSTKRLVFSSPANHNNKIYLGKSGSARFGSSFKESLPLGRSVKANWLECDAASRKPARAP